ncbi:hypothetical protein [Saccharothrix coeruleofusca]|uniref:Uncharacterized protein n=1 Tax=Saccharothrix coeruleofusca TaxID=33919 RepID=A0A918AX05_9PSEU|nr:hypothetical protein [Saccharothrix coeruleofusca]MBP2340732.1 hypothetical protein [Saccharothrix coeruleofusca]GGP88174.1 hypothetical protein GCM10010185_72000 [Saccharothrix coeruleofusca]
MSVPLATECTVVRLDVVDSSSGGRRRQAHLDQALSAALDLTLDSLSHHSRYASEPTFRRDDGDSVTLVFGANIPKAWVTADIVLRELDLALSEVNKPYNDAHRLRVRIAVDDGATVIDPPHISGSPVTTTARLIDAEPFRRAVLDAPEEDFGLIVSDRFHAEVVLGGERGLDRIAFRPVEVDVKGFQQTAWVYVPKRERSDHGM